MGAAQCYLNLRDNKSSGEGCDSAYLAIQLTHFIGVQVHHTLHAKFMTTISNKVENEYQFTVHHSGIAIGFTRIFLHASLCEGIVSSTHHG